MAGRAHVDVNERRLRPVYDALDNLNNKQAIQLADKILKKQKDLHCAKALKALALLRLNRTAESIEILEELKKIDAWDDSILQCMTMTYKEMQKPEEIANIYESAIGKNPKNEEFLSHLFMAYVRIGNNFKQQKTAMNLHKSFPHKNPYYFWAIMSIYMQALSSDDEKAVKSMLLPLAERMVKKYIKENKIEAEAEVQLYLMILEKAGKYDEALSILRDGSEGSVGNLINDKDDILIRYLEKLENWSDLNRFYKMLLIDRPDQWQYYVGYLDTGYKLVRNKWTPDLDEPTSASVDYTCALMAEFLDKNLDEHSEIRGPYLAKMELMKRMVLEEHDCQDELLNQLIVYFDKFGCRSCCFSDISPYIDLLNEDKRNQFTELVAERIHDVSDDATTTEKVKNLQKFICKECIERRLGYSEGLSPNERLQKAKELMKKHKSCISYGEDLLPTDIQPVDPLALLAVYLLVNIKDHEEDSQKMIWHILLILEEASRLSPSNHEFKILKMEIYSTLGAFGPCYKISDELEIKYVMLDTLGYKVTRYAQPLCHFQSASSFYSTTLKFFHANQKDTAEQIVAAYRYGAFRKIPEMTEFRDRLNTSMQFSHVLFEKRHLDLLLRANSIEETKDILKESDLLGSCPSTQTHFDGLVDNRDFSVLNFYDSPPRIPTSEHVKISKSQELLWIRYRCLSLRILGITFEHLKSGRTDHLVNGNSDRSQDGSPDGLEAVISQLQSVFEVAKDLKDAEAKFIAAYAIHGPPKSRWIRFCDGNFGQPVVITAKVVHQLMIPSENTHLEEELKKSVDMLSGWFKESFELSAENMVSYTWNKDLMNGSRFEQVSLLVEMVNYVTMMIALILELAKGKLKRSKKKKASSTNQLGMVKMFDSLVQEILDKLVNLDKKLNELENDYISKELDEAALNDLFEKTQSDLVLEIWKNIQASYKQSIQEVSQIINLKIKFLQSLKS